jgi:hypothetical protein
MAPGHGAKEKDYDELFKTAVLSLNNENAINFPGRQ